MKHRRLFNNLFCGNELKLSGLGRKDCQFPRFPIKSRKKVNYRVPEFLSDWNKSQFI